MSVRSALDDTVRGLTAHPYLAAVEVALPLIAIDALLWPYVGHALMGVFLGYVAAVYLGFAVMDRRGGVLVLQAVVSLVFVAAAVVGVWRSAPLVLAAAYLAHALWDWLHHTRALGTHVERWYPPFCARVDVLIAGYLLARVAWLSP